MMGSENKKLKEREQIELGFDREIEWLKREREEKIEEFRKGWAGFIAKPYKEEQIDFGYVGNEMVTRKIQIDRESLVDQCQENLSGCYSKVVENIVAKLWDISEEEIDQMSNAQIFDIFGSGPLQIELNKLRKIHEMSLHDITVSFLMQNQKFNDEFTKALKMQEANDGVPPPLFNGTHSSILQQSLPSEGSEGKAKNYFKAIVDKIQSMTDKELVLHYDLRFEEGALETFKEAYKVIKKEKDRLRREQEKQLALIDEKICIIKKQKAIFLKKYDEKVMIPDLPQENYQAYMLAYFVIFIVQENLWDVRKEFVDLIWPNFTNELSAESQKEGELDAAIVRLCDNNKKMFLEEDKAYFGSYLFCALPEFISKIIEENKPNQVTEQASGGLFSLFSKKQKSKSEPTQEELLQDFLSAYAAQMKFMSTLDKLRERFTPKKCGTKKYIEIEPDDDEDDDQYEQMSRDGFFEIAQLEHTEAILLYALYKTYCDKLDLKKSAVEKIGAVRFNAAFS